MTLELRPPQKAALISSKKAYEEGFRRLLIQLPTGMGKTPTFAALRSFFGFEKKVLVLVHMEELAMQARDKLKHWNPHESVGVEMAGHRCSPGDTFIVASVPTLSRKDSPRLAQFNPADFDAVICDEAHHSIASTWKRVLEHFGFNEIDVSKHGTLLIGVTATPNRGDKQGLAQMYDRLVYQYSILDAVCDGWLVSPRGYRISTSQSLEGVHTRAGDFNQSELAAAVDNFKRNGMVVDGYIKHGEARRAIAFCADIEHAKHLAQEFNEKGIAAAAIWGDDPDRAAKMRAHREGKILVLTNCNVLTEGYDDPLIGCIILARPTKSQLLLIQMVGRGLRLQTGISNLNDARSAGYALLKEDAIVLDVVDNTDEHSLTTLPSLFGLPASLDMKGKVLEEVSEKFAEYSEKYPNIDFSELKDIDLIQTHAESVDLFSSKMPESIVAASSLQWYRTPDGAYILRLPKTHEHIEVSRWLKKDGWVASGTI